MSWNRSHALTAVAGLTLVAALVASTALGAGQPCTSPLLCPSAATPPPPPSVVKVSRSGAVCSGTVISSTPDECLIVCCNHCFADHPWPGGVIPKGKYPAECAITWLSDGTKTAATAVDGDPGCDIALCVARTSKPATPAPRGTASVGQSCEHYGVSSGRAAGRITRYDDTGRLPCDQSQRSTSPSIPGDSGAGVFVAGKIVAVNWGYWPSGEQGGTAVRFVLRVARGSERLRSLYRRLWDNIPSDPPVPDVYPPIPRPDPVTTPPTWPIPVYPAPPGYSRPRLFPILPWRRW